MDVLIVTAADDEDTALRSIETNADGAWTDFPREEHGWPYGVRRFRTATGHLTVGHVHTRAMGETMAAHVATKVIGALNPSMLAMCGVCAGRPGTANLGDVVIAEHVFKYDAGAVERRTPGGPEIFHPDGRTRDLPADLLHAAQDFSKAYPKTADGQALSTARPWPMDHARLWLLEQLVASADPDFGRAIHLVDAAWKALIAELETSGLVELKRGVLHATDAGRDMLANEKLRRRGKLDPAPWEIHVAPFGTGSALRRDVDIWKRLSEGQARHVAALDMEAAAVGEVGWLEDRPTVVAKAVMDFAEPDRKQHFRAFAARASAEVLLAFLREHAPSVLLKRSGSVADEQKVLAYSESMMAGLRGSEGFEVRGTRIAVTRDCEATLKELAETGPVLVLGAPGEGKSAVLSRFAREQREAGRDVLLLRADTLPADGAEGLRSLLGTQYTLPTLLSRWPGSAPGYVIIDALDAARTPTAMASVRLLIEQLQSSGSGRWKVVASIREYDLRYSKPVRALFRGTPAIHHAFSEFSGVRHVYIEPLSDAEFDQVRQQSPPLAALYKRAGERTQKLLRTPFNLTLAADLLDSEAGADELLEVTTQVELLNRYWQARVEDPDFGHGREALLRDVVEKMIAGGALRVRRSDIEEMTRAELLPQLLRNRVLQEESSAASGGAPYISFPHHILFDYAVERLLLRGEPRELADRLEARRELALTIRPSLVMHFHFLWSLVPRNDSREAFWANAIEVTLRAGVPQVGKGVAATVAAELFESLADFEPLFAALRGTDETRQQAAASLLMQVVVARKGVPTPRPLTGVGTQPWCQFARQAAESLVTIGDKTSDQLLQAVLELLRDITEEAQWDTGQLAAAGEASRQTLKKLMKDPRQRSNLRLAIRPLCRTAGSDPKASAEALRPLLTPEAVAEYGYLTLESMAWEIEHVIEADADLAREIYEAAFRFEEPRKDTIALSTGVVGLNTTIEQSYDGARWSLSEAFAAFLRKAWRPALRALIVAVDAYIQGKEREKQPPWRLFEFDGHNTGLRRDFSAIFDTDRGPRGYDALPMVGDFFAFLAEQCAPDGEPSLRREIVAFLVTEPRTAMWWRRLLMTATAHAGTLGHELRALTWNPVLQTAYDTAHGVGTLITALYDQLSEEERRRVEQSLLALSGINDETLELDVESLQSRLLHSLPPTLIVTEEARRLRAQLEEANELKPNVPPYRCSRVTGGAYTEEHQLRDAGISLEAVRTQRVLALMKPIRGFCRLHESNGEAASVEGIEEQLSPLHKALTQSELAQEDDQLIERAWRTLSEAAELAAASPALKNAPPIQFLRQLLLTASISKWPRVPETVEDHTSGLVLTGPRFAAAGGLIALLRHLGPSDNEVFTRIEQLAHDDVRSVRRRVAEGLGVLLQVDTPRTWTLIESFVDGEHRGSVLAEVFRQLDPIVRSRPADVARLVTKVFDQWRAAAGNDKVCGQCVSLSLDLWLNHGQLSAKHVVDTIASDPGMAHEATHSLLRSLRDMLIYGESEDARARSWRQASFDIFDRVLGASLQKLEEIGKQMRSASSPDEREALGKQARSYAQHIGTIGYELYFGSGAHDAEKNDRAADDKAPPVTAAIKQRFFLEALGVLKALGNSGAPSVIHNVVKTLAFLADAVPDKVLLLIGEILKEPSNIRYAADSLARDAVIELLDSYLAHHHDLLMVPGPCQAAFLDSLDAFARAGHPEAIRFAHRAAEGLR